MSKSLVALAKGSDVQANVTKVFEQMGGVTNMIAKGETVVIKPNAGHANPADSAVDTNPETLRAVIREIKKAEPGRIIVAEAAAIGCDTMECFEVCGIKAVVEEEGGVELIDIKRDKDLINIPVRGYRSNISHCKLPRFLLEAEHIVNLPILKAHASMVFSGALKNIKGVVQDRVHMDMHAQNLTMAMMDVWYAARPDINIMDAMYAAGGYSPHTPVPLKVDCILGSYDPVALDRVACALVGIDTDLVDYFDVAKEVGLGETSLDNIEIAGDSLEACKTRMWVPYVGDMASRWPEYDVHCQGGCSSCQALLSINMEELKAIGIYDENAGSSVAIGPCKGDEIPADVPDEKIFLQGNCTKSYLKDHPNAYWIPGCPPVEPALYLTIQNKDVIVDAERFRPMMARDHEVWQNYVKDKADAYYSSLTAEDQIYKGSN